MHGIESRTAAAELLFLHLLGPLIISVALVQLGAAAPPDDKPKTYYGHKVLRLTPVTDKQRFLLHEIRAGATLEVDFWTEVGVVNSSVDIRVPPKVLPFFEKIITDAGMQSQIIIENVQKLVDRERRENSYRRRRYRRSIASVRREHFKLNKYHPLAEIIDFEDQLLSKYPRILSAEVIGNSTEGRPVRVLKIHAPYDEENDLQGAGTPRRKPAIWIDGGTHAREWISHATVLYLIAQLLVFYQSDPEVAALVDGADWYFLPVANPDGYYHSWNNDRMWRKTRSRHEKGRGGRVCYGVDPNRNFDHHWGEKGTSGNPCSEIYRGPHAFSEPEIGAISQFMLRHQEQLRVFLSFHANGQLWMLPWGYTRELPDKYTEMYEVAELALQALQEKHGTLFLLGSIANIIYEASGTSADWVHGVAGVPYSYGIELRDIGYFGFMLPASQIIPSGEEMWSAVKVIAGHVIRDSRSTLSEADTVLEQDSELEALLSEDEVEEAIVDVHDDYLHVEEDGREDAATVIEEVLVAIEDVIADEDDIFLSVDGLVVDDGGTAEERTNEIVF